MKVLYYTALIWWLRKRNPSAVATFWYSKKQDSISSKFPEVLIEDVRFKGKKYSEMKNFEFGLFINWDDAILVGIGNYSDITFK